MPRFPSFGCQALRSFGCNPILLAIFLVSLVLRVLGITVAFNVDERNWMRRGSLFLWRLLEGDLADTYLRHHPGVTNMWLTGSSQLLNCQFHKLFPGWLNLNQAQSLEACLNTSNFPISSFVMPRLLQAVMTSACMVGIYILAKRLLGRPAALAAISLLILEPFFLAYQRSITTDALQTDFGILGLLLLLLYLRGDGTRRTLVASGALMGLALAAKIPTIFVLPGVGLWIVLIELGVWQASFPQRGWKRQTVDMMLWGITFCAVIFLIWPALWVGSSLRDFG
ncbi:glycosyltransferase family 39 protein [Moorena producens JHB]|uniref:Glycosyltransferase family 39 protein n=1 Tax=Moorena producens (strain JHB) TaxID=1454205 RepID=A0A1D9FYY7_MOOP1|nr:glycosyltransferase family 39 protein [Moorena producens]AOY80541.2 glycosyltransferase family 39 protein [Moorena producens JHB]